MALRVILLVIVTKTIVTSNIKFVFNSAINRVQLVVVVDGARITLKMLLLGEV